MPKRPRKPPYRVLWEITWRCDLRCEHCLVDGGEPRRDELTTGEALDLIDQCAALGAGVVSLTGGEPFLRPDWPELAARVRQRGLILRFACNGHWLSAEVVRRLVELGAESVTVSVDGSPATHDRLRHGPRGEGPSSFERVIAAIDRLKATPIAVEVITAVSRQNLGELPAIHSLLKERRVDRWIVQLVHPTGRLAPERRNGACEPIEPAQLAVVADFIGQRANDPHLQPRAFNSIGYLSRQEPTLRQSGRRDRSPLWRGCRCGVTHLGVEPDGGVKGCANQVGAPFVVGNVRHEPLRAIWEDRARWHWLNPAPERMEGACAGCALAKFCQAGCTTLAYRSTGRLFDNPYCLRRLERAEESAT